MKILIIITTLIFTANMTSFSQTDSVVNDMKKITRNTFYLYYGFSGLGSNHGSFQPTIKMLDTNFIYTYEQNSYWKEKSKEVDIICFGILRKSSIDSILNLIQPFKDRTIFKTNACVMSGGIYFLTISNGIDTTRFELGNTFDYTALKIVDIINPYLPIEKRLWPTERLIKDEQDCWAYLMNSKESDKKKKYKKLKK